MGLLLSSACFIFEFPRKMNNHKGDFKTNTMKIFLLTLVSLLAFVDSPPSFSLTINQNLKLTNHISTIILDFEGDIDVVETIGNEISIETQLISSHASVMQYEENKRQFQIVPSFKTYNETEMVLKPKKINTSIFVKGEKYNTIKKYKIAIPAHIQVVKKKLIK